jgi:hypothetical protein
MPARSARLSALAPAALALATGLVPAAASAQAWSEITPTSGPAPTPRGLAAGVHDTARHRLVIFGGHGAAGFLAEVWAFDLASETWTDLTPAAGPAPAPRRTPNAAYDPDHDRIVTWSGQGATFFNDSWVFDLSTNAWTQLAPAGPLPNIRYGVSSVWDPATKELVSFAGFTSGGRFQDTWRLDAAAETWTDVTPAGPLPAARCLHASSYDSREHRLIMYGGQINGAQDDIWAFDLTADTWTELSPPVRPLGRWFAVNVYDPTSHRITVFGGDRGTVGGGRTNEVQLFHLDRNEWQQLAVAGTGPTRRDAACGIYVPGEDRMVVFGGNDGTNWLNEVWSLDGLSDAVAAPLPSPSAGRLVAYPNPFRDRTTVAFALPRAMDADIAVYDLAGRRVRALRGGAAPAGEGRVTWDGRGGAGERVPAGVYWVRLRGEAVNEAQRVIVLR